MKFVSMEVINKVFDDLSLVDYITVSNVTDSIVNLDVHLNRLKVPLNDTPDFQVFKDRCLVLGRMLDRKIYFNFYPMDLKTYIFYKIKKWLT